MANERKTENLVRKLLLEQGYSDSENVVIEEQQSDNPRIDKLLKNASKTGGGGKGFPEFIISFKDSPNNLVVIECKADTKYHKSKTKKKYKEYAVDGVLLYASYLKEGFNVVAIAVSGETEREMKISHFLWLKNKHTYKEINDKVLLDKKSLFSVVEKQSQPLKEEELNKKAIEYNELLHKHSIPEVDRCTVISSILVALQDMAFTNGFEDYHIIDEDDDSDDDGKLYNPNEDLIDGLLNACTTVLKRNKISKDKQEIILREYEKIKSNHTFRNRTISVKRADVINTVLRDLILDVKENIMPYINNNIYDVLGSFYTRFIRYAGSDSKTGLVLTPHHITDLFCDLAEINENDIVFDPCCGTGGFLVAAMNRMLDEAGNDLAKHRTIKSKQLIGVEKRSDMFSHACSNMMMRGDGKSHIHFGDCFNNALKQSINNEKPTKVFLNPPYDVGSIGQLEFVENAMEISSPGAICIAICQITTCTDTKNATIETRERILRNHTLEAVLSMPDELFSPVAVVTSILIFKTHSPHPKKKKSFFGYFKDDGFIKVKNKGRIDANARWLYIKEKWVSAYQNKENTAGLSVTKSVTGSDEWCAEAYMKTDYKNIKQEDFEDVIKEYIAFKVVNNGVS
jgi:type I restriction enzyme M protein